MSLFSVNLVVISSWKVTTLFQKGICFPGKAWEEPKEGGRRRGNIACFLFASTEFILCLGVRNEEKVRK